MNRAIHSANPDRKAIGPAACGTATVGAAAGKAYGKVLAYLDPRTLAMWTQGARSRTFFVRWYIKLFGFPELAAHRRFRQIQEKLGRSAGQKVLDLGAGAGLYSIADAIRRPSTVHFLADVSSRHMHRAQATAGSLNLPVGAMVGSGEALPVASETMDTVLVIEVLQFIDNDVRVIDEIGRILRPGGLWVCEQERPPDDAPLTRGDHRRLNEDRLTKRRSGYSAERLQALALRSGLILESSEVVSGRVSRWWEQLEDRILGRSRALQLLLFPLTRFLARLSALSSLEAEGGTILYVFRKSAPGSA